MSRRRDEEQYVDVFCRWLATEGWTVTREMDFVDVYAERGGERLYAEAKGHTSAPGLDIDAMYGQVPAAHAIRR